MMDDIIKRFPGAVCVYVERSADVTVQALAVWTRPKNAACQAPSSSPKRTFHEL